MTFYYIWKLESAAKDSFPARAVTCVDGQTQTSIEKEFGILKFKMPPQCHEAMNGRDHLDPSADDDAM